MAEATSLTDLPFHELTSRLASRDPVPGGGTAAALGGAIAAALVSMVAELTPGDELAQQLGADARAQMGELAELAQADADAYAAVVTARRMPKGTDPEREARRSALRSAMAEAATTPLRTAEAAAGILELAEQLAPIGNPNAASDVGVAAGLAAAAVRGALLNVRINLPYLAADEPLRATLPVDVRRLDALATAREDRIAELVAGRMEPT